VRIPWARVSRRARAFADHYADLYFGRVAGEDARRKKFREYIQSAWQCGFEAGRATQRRVEASRRAEVA